MGVPTPTSVRVINASDKTISAYLGGVNAASQLPPLGFSCYQRKVGAAGTIYSFTAQNDATGQVYVTDPSALLVDNVRDYDFVFFGSGANYQLVKFPESRSTGSGPVINVVNALLTQTPFDLQETDLTTNSTQDWGPFNTSNRLIQVPFSWGGEVRNNVVFKLVAGGRIYASINLQNLDPNVEVQVVFYGIPTGGIGARAYFTNASGCMPPTGGDSTSAEVVNALTDATDSPITVSLPKLISLPALGQGEVSQQFAAPLGPEQLSVQGPTGGVLTQPVETLDNTSRNVFVVVGDLQNGYNVLNHTFQSGTKASSGQAFITLFHGITAQSQPVDFYIVPDGATIDTTPYKWQGAMPLTSKTLILNVSPNSTVPYKVIATEPNMPSSVLSEQTAQISAGASEFDVLVGHQPSSAGFIVAIEK